MAQELGDFIEAAGLLEYDPAAITRIYAGHPQRLIRRLWQTLVPIGLLLLGVAFDWIFQLLKDEERPGQLKKSNWQNKQAMRMLSIIRMRILWMWS